MTNYYVKNIQFNRKALREVYEIINEYEEDDLDKIPMKIKKVIEDNMDKEYEFDIDNLENIELIPDTKKILAYLYTEFLSSIEEKEVLKKLAKIQDEEKRKKEEEQIKNISVFRNNEEKISDKNTNIETSIIVYKETIFTKLKKWFKKLFN